MRYHIISILILLFVASALMGDELSDKQKQLNKIQSDLQTAETKARQAEAAKRQKEADMQRAKTAKTQTERELVKSKQEADQKLESLKNVKVVLQSVESNIEELKSLQKNQLTNLIRVNRTYSGVKFTHKNQHNLAVMVAQTRTKLDNLGDQQVSLIEVENAKGTEYTLAKKTYQEDYTNKTKLDKQVKNLESETKNLTKQQQQLQTQIANLKKAGAQLESLIAQLTNRTSQEGASYQFSSKTITWPVRGKIIRNFGTETRFDQTSVICNGIDIACAEWSNVLAADAGEIAYAGTMSGQGKLIIIDHKNGFHTVYAYNNEILVSAGSKVAKGQAIAKSGMTGSATAPSVHFELRKDGKAVNPLAYLD